MKIPAVDFVEIGAGGRDPRAALASDGGARLGGVEAGPCYGRGGTRADVTDADCVLGYIDPDFFPGG